MCHDKQSPFIRYMRMHGLYSANSKLHGTDTKHDYKRLKQAMCVSMFQVEVVKWYETIHGYQMV